MNKYRMLEADEQKDFLNTLQSRFENNMNRHKDLNWKKVLEKLENNIGKLSALWAMETTGGEPDVVDYLQESDTYIFFDCAPESPKGRRSVCYDRKALESRKKFPPKNNAMDMAREMGVEMLTQAEYKKLQQLGEFDTKTSSWLKTPTEIRELGGAIFGDFRFGTVFIYHNGAESYYAARGFRSSLKV
jgi:hypothetical protein